MTNLKNNDDKNDAEFETEATEKKSLTLSVSYSFMEKVIKIIIFVAVLSSIIVYASRHMDGKFGLFNDSVKIAVLNPSALNKQYMVAHNGNSDGYMPYIRKLMAIYRAKDYLVLDLNYVISRPSNVIEISYIADSDLERELAKYEIDPTLFEDKK